MFSLFFHLFNAKMKLGMESSLGDSLKEKVQEYVIMFQKPMKIFFQRLSLAIAYIKVILMGPS